jgi:hypothetical protein
MSTCIPAVGAHPTRLLGPAPRSRTLTPAGPRPAARTRATRPARRTFEHARAGAAKEPGLAWRAPR